MDSLDANDSVDPVYFRPFFPAPEDDSIRKENRVRALDETFIKVVHFLDKPAEFSSKAGIGIKTRNPPKKKIKELIIVLRSRDVDGGKGFQTALDLLMQPKMKKGKHINIFKKY